ncbi:MAG: ABC transporter permease [Clostridiales bacterium]|nr:ABC transporter permease [Clostridiales bacterium]
MSSGTLKAGLEQYEDASLLATTPGYDLIRSYGIMEGRFLTEPDVANRSFVAILGQEAAQELFGSIHALGLFRDIPSSWSEFWTRSEAVFPDQETTWSSSPLQLVNGYSSAKGLAASIFPPLQPTV